MQPVRGDLRAGLHARGRAGRAPDHRRPGRPRRPAVAGAHLPQGGGAARTSTRTPTGCGARSDGSARSGTRSPGTRRSTWSPTASPARSNEHGRDALAVYLGNPNVHSLGSMTHGTAMVKSFRTRNKYSATSVDQLPAQMLAYLMYGHQLMLPVPDLDRTAALPGLRREPDGLQRQPDDRAGLPRPAARAQGPRRPDGRGRPAPHRDRQGRARAPLRAAGHRRVRAARDAARALRRGPRPLPRRTSTGWTPCAPRSCRSPPSAPRRPAASTRTSYDAWRASSRPRSRRRSTAGSGCPPRSSASSPPGRCSCSTSSPATWTGPAA